MFDTNSVATLSDLQTIPLAKFPLAVFGKPIVHSLSPKMQNAALREMSKTNAKYNDWAYYKFEIDPKILGEALLEFHKRGFLGINLTIPHKEIVFDFLENASEFAKLARASNTLLRTPTGWQGFNTDGFGLTKAIELFSGRKFKESDVVILGAGGAAKAACFRASLDGCKSLKIWNRSQDRLQGLLQSLESANFKASALKSIEEIKPDSIIVNATSVGLHKEDSPVLDFSKLSKDCVFFDMPYIRGSETSSVLAARSVGINASSGLPMLAWQGAKSLSIWTGEESLLGNVMYKAISDC